MTHGPFSTYFNKKCNQNPTGCINHVILKFPNDARLIPGYDLLQSVSLKKKKTENNLLLTAIAFRHYHYYRTKTDQPSLELRWLRLDYICYFKVLNQYTSSDSNGNILIYASLAASRLKLPYLQKPTKAANKLLLLFFFYRQVDAQNALPVTIGSISLLPVFERERKNIDSTQKLKR